jgi:tryptophan halogenase
MNELDITTRMAEAGKVPFAKTGANESATYPLENYTNLGAFSIHFDAVRLAKYLRTVAEARGIKRVEGLVVDATQDEYGDLKKIILKSGLEVRCDFVFDASGFKRVLVGNKLGAEWVDYADKLPVNAAVPFFLPHNGNDIAPYTENIAMKHGWIWKVPVQHRIGCGYTYDSTQATKEEIIEEIEEYLGHKIEPVNFFTFNAGYYKTPWINNCIAVGLASGFVEPLEATSIWVTALTLQYALSNVEVLYSRDKRVADDLNKKFCKVNDQVSDFVYFHYMTERNDTEFWRKFSIENAPQSVKDVLSTWEYRLPQQDDYAGTPWTIHSWLQVGIGIGKANTELMKFSADNSAAHKHASTTYDELKHRGTVTVETMFRSHMDFLDDMNRVVEDK